MEKKDFVVVSDFHANKWALDKIKNHYLKEYKTIYILGDATDRGEDNKGTGGIQILLDIMQLSKEYPGEVIYIPGNHDKFLYDCAYRNDPESMQNMIYNGGHNTYMDIVKLKKKNKTLFNELMDWLGHLPLQRVHEVNGQKYDLAHAFFDKKMYDKYPNLCLADEEKLDETEKSHMENILWFRISQNDYDRELVPSKEEIIVIGHTPEMIRKNQNMNLVNANGEEVRVYCVDAGIPFSNRLLKFEGNTLQYSYRDRHLNARDNNTINMQDILLNIILENKNGSEIIYNLILASESGKRIILPKNVQMFCQYLLKEINNYRYDHYDDHHIPRFEDVFTDFINELIIDEILSKYYDVSIEELSEIIHGSSKNKENHDLLLLVNRLNKDAVNRIIKRDGYQSLEELLEKKRRIKH